MKFTHIVCCLSLLFVTALCHAQTSQGGIPYPLLTKLKKATVFIEVRTHRGRSSGTGFLMFKKNNIGYIVTNEHVVYPRRITPRTVTVVFNSGTDSEKSISATAVVANRSQDLALLRIKSAHLPQLISFDSKIKLYETLPIYIFGFPFGRALSVTSGNPAITISKGIISSMRTTKKGETYVQIDGELNPGNSGGPVVDSSGKLIGVAVAKLSGTHIGLVIPSREVEKLFLGHVGQISFKEQAKKKTLRLKIEVPIIDPMNNIKKISLFLAKKNHSKKIKRKRDGGWSSLSSSPLCSLKIKGKKAFSNILFKHGKHSEGTYLFQTKCTYKNNKVRYSRPTEFDVYFFDESITKSTYIENEYIKKMLSNAPPLHPDGIQKRLPFVVEDIRLAFGGLYLICKFKDRAKLGVYNILQNKFEKYIKLLDTESIFATGGNILICYSHTHRIFQVYDLTTWKRIKSKSYSSEKVITHMEMGIYNGKTAIVSLSEGIERNDGRTYALLKSKSLKIIPLKTEKGFTGRAYYRNKIRLRADGKLKRVICHYDLVELEGNRATISHSQQQGHFVPSWNGDYIFAERGSIYKSTLKNLIKRESGIVLPVYGSNYYILYQYNSRSFKDPYLILKDRSSLEMISKITAAIHLKTNRQYDLAVDRRTFAVGVIERLIQIDNKDRYIYVSPLKLPDGAISRKNRKGAIPGKTWEKMLNYPKNSQITVEDAPDGIKYHPDKMKLIWSVPETQQAGTYEILLSVLLHGEERYDRIMVAVNSD